MAQKFYESNYSREERRTFCRELIEKMLEEYESAEATK
jgi:tRNA(Ile)-lysidine synthase TilS/MesJ